METNEEEDTGRIKPTRYFFAGQVVVYLKKAVKPIRYTLLK